jgi:hypothetical protein
MYPQYNNNIINKIINKMNWYNLYLVSIINLKMTEYSCMTNVKVGSHKCQRLSSG